MVQELNNRRVSIFDFSLKLLALSMSVFVSFEDEILSAKVTNKLNRCAGTYTFHQILVKNLAFLAPNATKSQRIYLSLQT